MQTISTVDRQHVHAGPRELTRSQQKVVQKSVLPGLLINVMDSHARRQFWFLASFWAAGLFLFYFWWFNLEHVTHWSGYVLNTLLVTWTACLPGYFFYFVSRMKRVDPTISIPENWRVAMVTTRAPSEPFELVQETLKGMLSQPYPHDTWLADEDPTDEINRWCQENGVRISTRKGVDEYHRAEWPRRTKCKEGNLAYFYDHYGYEAYDFVVQLDADHVPQDGYLEEMLRPFVDDAVGYVSAPSICSKNSETSWSARGRLFSEALMHGPLQSGYSGSFAPLCIGSHYAVRTNALKEIGGLGPELAEDHSTTLMMNGHGWRGVHAMDAIAIGEGPPTLAACITQEFQWSRSLMVVMLTILPKYWSRLSWKLRFQFLFSELWYPLFSLTMLIGLALPVVAVMTKEPWVRVSYLDFIVHSLPLTLLTLAVQKFLKENQLLRPSNSPCITWEMFLFQIIRWPWSLYGSVMGAVMSIRQKNVVFRVTPKGGSHDETMAWQILMPYLAVLAVSFLPTLFVADAGTAKGYFFFLIMTQFMYTIALFSIVLIHRREVRKTLSADQ